MKAKKTGVNEAEIEGGNVMDDEDDDNDDMKTRKNTRKKKLEKNVKKKIKVRRNKYNTITTKWRMFEKMEKKLKEKDGRENEAENNDMKTHDAKIKLEKILEKED